MGLLARSPNDNKSMRRVKLYHMNDEGKWEDQGTGHVTVEYVESSKELRLFVVDEKNNEALLFHRISSDDIYRKQEDTIISWLDPEYSTDLALSFQENTGCSYIWDHICNTQRNMRFSSLTITNETIHVVNCELRELPPVELSTLPLIHKTIVESGIVDQLRVIEFITHDQDFFRRLMKLFRICEDLKNYDGLHLLFKIIKEIILLNSTQIFENIFKDEVIMDIIGCLEYDPEVPHVHHRNFLKKHVIFKEAIPIKDRIILSKVHQTYKVGYLKDVILPRALDASVVASLNTIIHSNNAIIVSLLKEDSTFIKELFARLKCPTISIEMKKTLVDFLHEFCTLSKNLLMVHQLRLIRDLVSEGIFDIIADVLQSEDANIVLTGKDIFIHLLNQDSNIVHSYVARQDVLLGVLVKNMLTDFKDDMHCQFLEIVRGLLNSSTPGSQKDTIVEIFYEKHLVQLIDAITSSCPPDTDGHVNTKSMNSDGGSSNPSRVKPEILLNICDLLCFCVIHHPYRIKCSFLLNNMIDKILLLTRRREKYLVVYAVRFVRTLISCSDEYLMNHFVKNNLFKPIVDAFVANGDRYNLLNSAVLELFEYIREENLKVLLTYLIDTFWEQLVKFDSLSSIRALKVKYEQLLESSTVRSTGSLLDSRNRINERALEKEEDDSDEEDSASSQNVSTKRSQPKQPAVVNVSSRPSPRSGGLVDYDDDEDDEEYKPPPKKRNVVSNESEGEGTEFLLKSKLVSKSELRKEKLQWPSKVLKTREGVFAAVESTLGRTVQPSLKAASSLIKLSELDEQKDDSAETNVAKKDSIIKPI